MKLTSALLSIFVEAQALLVFAATAQPEDAAPTRKSTPVLRGVAAPINLARLDPGWWRATTPTTSVQPPGFVAGANKTIIPPGTGSLFEIRIETCTPFVNIPGSFVANQEYWQDACKFVNPKATYVKLTTGDVTDYFRPKEGKTICDMLTASDEHEWSSDGANWVAPEPPSAVSGFGLGGLGGSADGWLPSRKSETDKRSTPSFWGIKGSGTQKGGCCHADYAAESQAWGQSFQMSYCGPPQELAPICTPVTTIAGTFSADKNYWKETCKSIPMTAGFVKINMGSIVDYFRPPTGKTYCEMLTAHDLHKWSKDGETWVDPTYGDAGLGGSAEKGVDSEDGREKVSFWGSDDQTQLGGCCYSTASDEKPGFGKSFTLSYCEIPQIPATAQLVDTLRSSEASVMALQQEMSKMHRTLSDAEAVNVDASGNVSLARSGMFKLAVKARNEADELAMFTKHISLMGSNMESAKTQINAAQKTVIKAAGTSADTAAIAKKVGSPEGMKEQEELNTKMWALMDPAKENNLPETEKTVRQMEKDTDKFVKELGEQVKTVLVTKMRRTAGRMRRAIHELGTAGNKKADSALGATESSTPLGSDLGLNDD